jgi:hypothetical protein
MAYRSSFPILGCDFKFLSEGPNLTHEVTLRPTGIDGKCRIPVSLDGVNFWNVVLSADLDCDLTVSGAGGLDTGTENTSTFYEVRLVTKARGEIPKLIFTELGSSPTMPADYTMRSHILWGIRNNVAGDIVPYVWSGPGICEYREWFDITNLLLIANGFADAVTLIPTEQYIPSNSFRVSLHVYGANDDATPNQLYIYRDEIGADLAYWSGDLADIAGYVISKSIIADLGIDDPSKAAYYAWADPTGGISGPEGANIYIVRWQIPPL